MCDCVRGRGGQSTASQMILGMESMPPVETWLQKYGPSTRCGRAPVFVPGKLDSSAQTSVANHVSFDGIYLILLHSHEDGTVNMGGRREEGEIFLKWWI